MTTQPDAAQELTAALACLRRGGVVALPTDTLYGLAADVFCEAALRRIYEIKGRPASLALPVLVASWEQVAQVAANAPPAAQRLAQRFWPGPLTLVLPKAAMLSPLVTGGRDTVAVRMPNHPAPLTLAAQLGRPITGTSANRSGAPDLLTLADVERELGGAVDFIIRTGPAPQGIASTIVDVTGEMPRLLRQGALPFNEVMRCLQSVDL